MNQSKSFTDKYDIKKIIIFIVVAIVLILLGCFISTLFKPKPSNDYQAVFLSNKQVYFGKIVNERDNFIEFTGIYYLRAQKDLDNLNKESDEFASAQGGESAVSLIKLGNELHGPQDTMHINKDHILFIEPLREDSKVVEAINNETK